MTNVSNLSHCSHNLRCGCTGGYAVAPVQCHVSNALHTALHCGPAQHTQPHTTYHPYKLLHKCQHASWELRTQHTHYIYAYTLIHACQFSNSTIMCSAFAVQAVRNSASGWGQTSSSCLCSCAPLHHASSQPCHAMLQSV